MFLASALLAGACTNHHIAFDELPNGTAVQSWTGSTSFNLNDPWVISTQYASAGVASFGSNGRDGVMVFADQSTASPPNTACPIGVAFGPSNFSGPTTITLGQSTTNVWVTIPASYPTVMVTARDANNNVLRTEASDGPNASVSATGRRVRVNVSGIRRVDLDSTQPGGRYCFDDFTWQEPW
jgi:hypothetical protein